MDPTEEDSDEKLLVERIQKRDTEALAIFLENNRPKLSSFLRSITGQRLLSVVEIDDLVQDIAATAVSSLETAPLDQYEPFQWVLQIARRRVVDAHRFHFEAKRRDAKRHQSLHAPDGKSGDAGLGWEQLLAASLTSPSAAMSQDIRMSRMQQAIASLSPEQQQVIRLRYVDGLPSKDIAEQLEKTDVAIRVLLSRSMRQLEKALEDVRPTR